MRTLAAPKEPDRFVADVVACGVCKLEQLRTRRCPIVAYRAERSWPSPPPQ